MGFFMMERVKTICAELAGYIDRARLPLDHWQYKEGHFPNGAAADAAPSPWRDFLPGMRWGGRDRHYWFRSDLAIPAAFQGQTLALQVATGQTKEAWDATNPQFFLYLDGTLIQGLDVNHREVIFARGGDADGSRSYRIDLAAYSGMLEQRSDLEVRLVAVDEPIKEFYYDLWVPLLVAQELPENDERRQALLEVLNGAVNRLDLRKPYSEPFYASLAAAADFLRQGLAALEERPEPPLATCVGHTHIDVAWLWTLAQTREKAARSFATVLKLMEEYPEYIFMSSQPQLYQFVKEDHPELYQKIAARIREGRWEAEGAMWVEADCNLASGESLVRQILFGTRFFQREFGVRNRLLWLPDVFGYSAALPQILKRSGIAYFMTTKISWNDFNKLPYDTFMWEGIDGTPVLTHFITTREPGAPPDSHFTTYNGKLTPAALIGGWQRYQQKSLNRDILIACGYGDGGGGTTPDMLEQGRRMSRALPGCPRVRPGTAGDYFRRLEQQLAGRPDLPKWVGELYLEFHRGTYTSMARNKRYNRKSELLYQDAEFLAVLGRLLAGQSYPQAALNRGWETILLNQFHDILPGSSIKEVYEESRRQYEQIIGAGRELAGHSLEAVAKAVQLEQPAVVVFNSLSFTRSAIVLADLDPDDSRYHSVIDATGRKRPLQRVESAGRNQVLFYAPDLPAKGYQAFPLSSEKVADPPELSVGPSLLENCYFRIAIDAQGNIASLFDKRNRRQVLKPGLAGNRLLAFEDKPAEYDNWNIDLYYQEKQWEIDAVEEIFVIEEGPVRGGLRIRKRFLDSVIVQDIYIYNDLPRIDFDTQIDWKESQILLKAAFPVDVHANKATYDIQFGNVERPTHWNTSWDLARFEVCAHKWADLSEAGYGVSLINDCKYGHDIKDGVIRLTLLKSGNHPNPEADRELHHFVYSLYPHPGDWREGGTVQTAYSVNVPVYAQPEPAHPGSLPATLSLLALDRENVILETVKQAEDDGGVVLRLHECYNRRNVVTLRSHLPLQRAVECNLLEEEEAELAVAGERELRLEMKPYEIKTLKLEFRD
jgi:alpha-mannosidase